MTQTKEKTAYESLFIVPPETAPATVDGFVEKVKSILAKSNSEFQNSQVLGRRRLAYPIRQHKDGIYVHFEFAGTGESQKEIQNLFHVTDYVIRHITVKKETKKSRRSRPRAASSPSAGSTSPSTPSHQH